ncbi:hypothetical protein UVI_02049870 [Ustilaginoidea virens]|uniref:Rhodopsin domain-containing protein n=1 Tax=Ustilaginoidea virens TaxID=1159556 RepID=A0A1B5L1T3_USTVR|nr:hypothetical protein UVI_02049870 [Ustilaginoidea virens]
MNITQTACHRPRLAYKVYARLGLGLDDWFALITLLVGIPSSVINGHYLTVNGIGRDIWTLTPGQITDFNRYFYLDAIVYLAEVSLAKLAILFFYMRIFPSRGVKRVLWGTVAFDCAFGAAFVLVAIFQCNPVSYSWAMWDGERQGRCLNVNAITWSNAMISIALDIWMLAIPLWQLRSLNLGWKKKAGVGAMFSVGAFVTIVSILRLKSFVAFSYSTDNPTWDFFEVGMWSDIEINVSMICACLPTFRLLLVRIFPILRETTHSTVFSQRAEAGRAVDKSEIWYQKSFAVKYLETDELRLMSMRDRDTASAQSGAMSI